MSSDLAPFVILIVVVVAAVAGFGLLQARKRREELAAFAAQQGWTHTPRDNSWTRRFSGPPFGRGDARRATNVLQGEHDGRPMVAFDYSYQVTTGSGDNRSTTTYHHSVIGLGVGTRLPALSVTPEGFFGRLVGRLTNRDIELESEDFNRAFTVTCPDRKFAFDVLHPRTMELLLQTPDIAWRFEADTLLAVSSGKHSPAEVLRVLGVLDAVLDGIPEFVWREVRS